MGTLIILGPVAPALAAPGDTPQLSFSSSTITIGGANPESIATSDFDGDGHLDLATADEGNAASIGGVSILHGDGSGGFTDTGEIPAGRNPIAVDVGQLNSDQHADLVVANHGSADVTVLLGHGDGTFAPADYSLGGCSIPEAIKVGFFNADRYADIAVADFGCNTVAILLGNGDGTFGAPLTVNNIIAPDALATADFNNDGNLDLVAPMANSIGSMVLLGHGDGTFAAIEGPTTGGDLFAEAATGDLNGDGKADVVFASGQLFSNGKIVPYLGNGDGSFTAVGNGYVVGDATTSVALADLNDDTVLDVVTTDNVGGSVWVLPGLGNGSLGNPLPFTAPGANWVTVGNVDADALPDLAASAIYLDTSNNTLVNAVAVLLNTTAPATPGPQVTVAAGGSCAPDGNAGTIRLALADVGDPSATELSVTSSNPSLVPTSAVLFAGSGTSRTATVRPIARATGSAVVTVNQLSGGQRVGSVSFAVRVGGTGADTLAGDDGADILLGQTGPDRLFGMGGNDLLCGGTGPDQLTGGQGADHFGGGTGKDVVTDLSTTGGDTQDGSIP